MSWFNLSKTMGSNYTVAPQDIVNTKTALNQLGYYPVPDRGIDDWSDDPMFDGIKAFQKDNGLKVDGLMRPGGPTEVAINARLDGQNDGQVVLAAGRRDPNVILPSQIPPTQRTPDGRPGVRHIPPEYVPEYPDSRTMKNRNTGEICSPGTNWLGQFTCKPVGRRDWPGNR